MRVLHRRASRHVLATDDDRSTRRPVPRWLRWWRSRSLAAQLVLTNSSWWRSGRATTRQIITLQDGRREDAGAGCRTGRSGRARHGSGSIRRSRISPPDQRGFALTGDSTFLGPYRLGRIQLDAGDRLAVEARPGKRGALARRGPARPRDAVLGARGDAAVRGAIRLVARRHGRRAGPQRRRC